MSQCLSLLWCMFMCWVTYNLYKCFMYSLFPSSFIKARSQWGLMIYPTTGYLRTQRETLLFHRVNLICPRSSSCTILTSTISLGNTLNRQTQSRAIPLFIKMSTQIPCVLAMHYIPLHRLLQLEGHQLNHDDSGPAKSTLVRIKWSRLFDTEQAGVVVEVHDRAVPLIFYIHIEHHRRICRTMLLPFTIQNLDLSLDLTPPCITLSWAPRMQSEGGPCWEGIVDTGTFAFWSWPMHRQSLASSWNKPNCTFHWLNNALFDLVSDNSIIHVLGHDICVLSEMPQQAMKSLQAQLMIVRQELVWVILPGKWHLILAINKTDLVSEFVQNWTIRASNTEGLQLLKWL